jgi:hypothetical protein
MFTLKPNFNKNNRALGGKRGMKAPKERHHMNRQGLKVK